MNIHQQIHHLEIAIEQQESSLNHMKYALNCLEKELNQTKVKVK